MDIQRLFHIAETFFFIYLVIYVSYTLVGNIFALYQLYHNQRKKILANELDHDYYFPVSILVPAYNESETILTTIENLLLMDYRLFEIIIIDDGSKDDTASKVIEHYGLHLSNQPVRLQVKSHLIKRIYENKIKNITIKLVHKENGGNKADAINAGINVCQYPYFVSMDGDEILQADALKASARHLLEDENTIAVGGVLNIANGVRFEDGYPVETKLSKNKLVAMQTLEYARAFMGSRIFNDAFNGNLNVSGGYGLFRKEAVIAVNGYDPHSVGEDMDLAMRLHIHYRKNKIPYNIKFASDAVCWTQAPFTLNDLAKQRSRWHRGLIQTMFNHKELALAHRYSYLSLVSYSYLFLFELMAPIIEVLGILVIILGLSYSLINIQSAILIGVMYFIFSMVQTLIFYFGRYLIYDYSQYSGDWLRAIGTSFLDAIFFRPYLLVVRLYAIFTYRSRLHSWSSLTRESLDQANT
ncbi:glycosyltransferase [Aerococcaceae bacterium WGS1372]